MRLFQPNMYISIDFLFHITELFKLIDEKEDVETDGFTAAILGQIEKGQKKRNVLYKKLTPPEENALQLELQSFIHCVTTGDEPPITGEDARRALAVASEITDIVKQNTVEK